MKRTPSRRIAICLSAADFKLLRAYCAAHDRKPSNVVKLGLQCLGVLPVPRVAKVVGDVVRRARGDA